ncbi:hypothetical protein NEOLEDRAFT_418553 [Neolentinus lepideus HHB14362 ss-1]|uniref:Zn(2)-C6 fungal-type domain-containing protein n=1 Tax=Neolentinus lepideus HHB14362 ss-1 TaxID=1314782 RepID=A0A165RZ63_9AGAM|nr:hypothetical protein NEOLEDRAFT_418553 [Neolentinus lepideus HHB14362 ss-1]
MCSQTGSNDILGIDARDEIEHRIPKLREKGLIACDHCRERKTKCEPSPSSSKCVRCTKDRVDCRFIPRKGRAKKSTPGVSSSQNRGQGFASPTESVLPAPYIAEHVQPLNCNVAPAVPVPPMFYGFGHAPIKTYMLEPVDVTPISAQGMYDTAVQPNASLHQTDNTVYLPYPSMDLLVSSRLAVRCY